MLNNSEMESDTTSVLSKNKKLEYIIDYCRVCMCRRDEDMTSIFDSQDDNLIDRIKFCTGLEFKKQDGLPTHICHNCTQNLNVAHKFKTSCLESENVFRKIIQECKDEPEDLNDFLNNYEDNDHDGDTEFNISNENISKSMELKDDVEYVRKSMDYEDEVLEKVSDENTRKTEEISNENTRKYFRFDFEDGALEEISNDNLRKSMDFDDGVLEKVSNENVRKSMDFEDEGLDNVSNENVRKSIDFEAEVLKNVSNENIRTTRARVKKKNDSMVVNQIEKVTEIKIQEEKERPKFTQGNKKITEEKEKKIEEKERPKIMLGPHEKSKPMKIKSSNLDRLQCEPCNLKFKSKAESIEHQKVAHKNERTMCKVCGKVFRKRRTRDLHMVTHQPPKYECPHCDYKTCRKSNFTRHIVRRHGDIQLECELYSRSYNKKSELGDHIRTFDEGMKKFQCNLCDKQFAFRSSLIRHINSHYENRTLHLEKEKGTSKIIRNPHKKSERTETSIICEVCGKVFSTKPILKVHMFTHQPAKFECDHCDYRACKKYEMVSHMRIHGGVKRFKCKLCSRSYYENTELNSHIRAYHEGGKKFQCDICDKRFAVRSKLNTHTRTHEEKQHECEVCHRRFLRRSYWRVHLKQHHGVEVPILSRRGINRKQTLFDDTRGITQSAEGEKRYQCEFCPRSYTTFTHLDAHIRICHEAGKNPQCKICNKEFLDKYKLKTHMDIHDKSKRIECEICHNTFSRRAFWRLHLQRQHGLKAPVPSCPRRLSPREEMALLLSNNTGAIAKSHAKQTLATDN